MPSIEDWAAKAADRIDSEYVAGQTSWSNPKPRPSRAHIAAIIATFAEPILKLLAESRQEHYKSETDDMNNCPMRFTEESCHRMSIKRVCDCGASEWNKRIDDATS